MTIKDIKDKKMVLSNFGTIITGGTEYSIDEFEKLINGGEAFFKPLEFSYDSEKKSFTLKAISKYDDYDYYYGYDREDYNGVRIYSLHLTSKQKEMLEQGKIDTNLQRLIGLAEKSQYEKKQRDIHAKVLETGEYPTSREDIKAYKDYLQEQLIRTNSAIVANRIAAVSPIVAAGLCALFVKATGLSFEYHQALLAVLSLSGTVLTGLYSLGIGGHVLFDNDSPLQANKNNKKNIGLLKQKIEDLEGTDKDKALFNASVELSPEGLEHEEVGKTNQYNNVFLQEINEVKKLIVKLPKNERAGYVKDLAAILAEYIAGVEKIVDKKSTKLEFGTASYIWELNSQMLPDVFRLGAVVKERLATIEEKKEVLNDCQEVKESIDALSTDSLGYTDGWTDDLSSTGFAYAEPRKSM